MDSAGDMLDLSETVGRGVRKKENGTAELALKESPEGEEKSAVLVAVRDQQTAERNTSDRNEAGGTAGLRNRRMNLKSGG